MRTILVIEDNDAIREELIEILQLEGFRVVFGVDGREGVAVAQREHPDLILCDLMMPNLDGFGTLQAVRADPTLAATPFVFLSARKEDADLQRGIDLEADGYLTKPCEIGPLLWPPSTRHWRPAPPAVESGPPAYGLRHSPV